MMETTLAQLLNHIYELELENAQLKKEKELLEKFFKENPDILEKYTKQGE